MHCDCSGKSITASTIPVHCSASSSLFARHSARSRGSRNPRYSDIFLLEFTIYRIYQRLLFVSSRSPPFSLDTHGPRDLLLHIQETRSDRSKKQGCFFLSVLFSNMLALGLFWALDNSFNTSSSLLRGTPSASKGAVTHITAQFLLAFIIYRSYQLLLFVGCFRICSSLRSIFAWPTLVLHSTRHFSAYSERVLRTSSRLPL